MTRKLLLCVWLVALGLVAPATASAAKLDIGLVIDGSGSIDDADWRLQREGFATALRDPANVPLDGSIAIAVVQFSSGATEEVPRTVIDSQEALDKRRQARSSRWTSAARGPIRAAASRPASPPWASCARTPRRSCACPPTARPTRVRPWTPR